MFTGACKKITGNGLASGCQLFYRKIYGYFLQCRNNSLNVLRHKAQISRLVRPYFFILGHFNSFAPEKHWYIDILVQEVKY